MLHKTKAAPVTRDRLTSLAKREYPTFWRWEISASIDKMITTPLRFLSRSAWMAAAVRPAATPGECSDTLLAGGPQGARYVEELSERLTLSC